LVETSASASRQSRVSSFESQTLASVNTAKLPRVDTGSGELNQVVGGGLVPGSVTLLSGDPGVGKSTLVLQLAAKVAASQPVLYVSGEESAAQIKLRAERLGLAGAKLELMCETDAAGIAATLHERDYGLVVVDSIQTMSVDQLAGAAGSVGQITASTQTLMAATKQCHTAMIVIGHVTKEGNIAGPKILEHLVDVVLYLEGDRYGQFKALRGVKNRFGSTDEVGIFEMTGQGLSEVASPSASLLAERQPGAGSVVLATLEGSRPVLVEVQALVSTTAFGYPKRTAEGFDLNRLNLLAAVLARRAGLDLSNQDIYVNIVGGLKITEPAADLAIILAIASAYKNHPICHDLVVFGEVGLSGEIRQVAGAAKRLAEARKLGFTGCVQARTATEAIQAVC
jgi:DNA repair protein RadA/Sms